ncbi:MAG: PqqD family peptide modification chaperone [Anaerolineaceae bacterium]|nr:PqqD family peptide modification chaperone [Anaerolineaceae bacterium]
MDHKTQSPLKVDDLWKQAKKILPNPATLENGLGLWGSIVIKPGGIWKMANEETLILFRSNNQMKIWRKHFNQKNLNDHSEINLYQRLLKQIPAVEITEEEVDLWEALGEETIILPRVKKTLPKIRNASKAKPIRISGWALKELKTNQMEPYWVLKNIELGTYMRLNEQQVYLWEMLDGMHTVQDLAVAMFLKYQTMAISGFMEFIEHLEKNGFLVDPYVNIYQTISVEIKRRSIMYYVKKIFRTLASSEFSFKKVDEFYTRVYQVFGKIMFSPVLIVFMLLVCVAGLPAYVILTYRGELSLLGNTSIGFGLVSLWIAQLFAIFTHESAHALTTKHYRRTVRRGGFGLYFGLPAFFMDTTDIWMEPRGPRLAVTWAGPVAGFVIGGGISIALLFIPAYNWVGFAYQFATFCIIGTLVNLNPLLKYDGYYILMDWLEIPKLRERSFHFLRQELMPKLMKKQKLTKKETIYTIYGTAASLFTGLFAFFVLKIYGENVLRFISSFNLIGN